jgi:hypothetical protein
MNCFGADSNALVWIPWGAQMAPARRRMLGRAVRRARVGGTPGVVTHGCSVVVPGAIAHGAVNSVAAAQNAGLVDSAPTRRPRARRRSVRADNARAQLGWTAQNAGYGAGPWSATAGVLCAPAFARARGSAPRWNAGSGAGPRSATAVILCVAASARVHDTAPRPNAGYLERV